ncbi:MAG TPA: radical SAM protein [Anaerolineaceae bacterium]|jgi:anaerobic magnesium-protoporphyrin IX monomethyl ester cyclase
MSDVLFGQSYYLRFDPKLWEAMQPYPPLGALYAASLIRGRGYSVGLFDAMLAGSEEEWALALSRERPRFAVLFEDNFNYLSKMCLLRMRQAAFTMITYARRAGSTVIVCGADATDHAEEYLEQGADFILTGEGEETLSGLLDVLSGRSAGELGGILGLVFREADGRLVRTPRRPDLRDLDGLPFPAWDLVDVERYRQVWIERHGRFSMNMVTTRGCPFHCNWCAKPIWGQRYNVRSPQNVVAEMRWLVDTYHPDHIWFADDIFGLQPGWLEQYASLLETEQLRIPFKSLNRADLLLRGDTAKALARAGAEIVWIGAESGSQAILDGMEKGNRVEQIYAAAERLHGVGVQVGFFLQFGYPGEGLPDIEKTIRMVRDCHPDDIGISVSYPLPGTRFYAMVHEQLGVKRNWTDSADLAMMYRGPFGTQFYRQLHRVVHREFRARKTWRELRRGGLGQAHLRQVGSMLFQWASLPVERWRLQRLAGQGQPEIGPLRTELDPEAAARPTPQSDR